MTREYARPETPPVLGIEAGGTRSVAILAGGGGRGERRVEWEAPANLRLMSDRQLHGMLRGLAAQLPPPAALGIGMAGVMDQADRARLRAAAGRVWPGRPCWVGNDLETAMAAAGKRPDGAVRVVLISGTGSACYGRGPDGAEAITGGWGHLLGDHASGYDIARRSLQAVILRFDECGRWPPLGARFLRALQLNAPQDLIAWARDAQKAELAALATEVFGAAARGDRIARRILDESAAMLARTAVLCARRLARDGQRVEFVLTGGILQKQRGFARQVGRRIRKGWPAARVRRLAREGAWGAADLAREHARDVARAPAAHARRAGAGGSGLAPDAIPGSCGLSPTEARNPRSRRLDRMSVPAAIRLMLREDAAIPAALRREERKIARAVDLIVRGFRRGGRLIYVGAGTSGRLGVLDACECPPTFGVPPDMVQAILAGSGQALKGATEAAEDDLAGGALAVRSRGVSRRDVVVGIAASGRTPFVWGALHEARRRGAATVLVCFNPALAFRRGARPSLVIAPAIGPEILTGSTRLKAGTATKLLLNIFTTLAMVRMGKVVENLMVDVRASNAKLRDRAIRIVQELRGVPRPAAVAALHACAWSVPRALRQLRAEPAARGRSR